ncbi:MAG: hypothetical protein CME65_02520 [Halobacteriovoraceae bacterium]|nr:hypothetical protein [Halobacteriovoraceae bacterium]|tara:strand:- start:667 stop:1128 length:462 start_codon:yes stop_codon:yes gene_type:complete
MNNLILLTFLFLSACSGAFRPPQKTPVTFDCEAQNRWTKKLNHYPVKMAGRTLVLKMQAEIFESPDRIKRYSEGIPIEGRVVYIRTDFLRLKTKGFTGVSNFSSRGLTYTLRLQDQSGPVEIFIAPDEDYGYYQWGESRYALICDLDPFKDED